MSNLPTAACSYYLFKLFSSFSMNPHCGNRHSSTYLPLSPSFLLILQLILMKLYAYKLCLLQVLADIILSLF